ncbi:MAG: hypothetical protein ABSA75_12870 [Candidatus Bathyarchaeia archaeon]
MGLLDLLFVVAVILIVLWLDADYNVSQTATKNSASSANAASQLF